MTVLMTGSSSVNTCEVNKGQLGPRFWDITKHAKPGATDAEMADALRQETWE